MAAMTALDRAREAFAARRWDVAYAAYSSCDGLSGDDLDALGEAAHWLGRPDESIVAYAEAYRLHRDAGDDRQASLSALLIACHLRFQGAGVEADGWLARCVRLLSVVEEGPEHGYPLHLEIPPLLAVDPVAAVASARRMQHLGGRFGDESLVALGAYYEGRVLVKQARVREGLAMLDEAMLAALSDELKPIWTGVIYCGLLEACHELVDLRRAQEWTEAMSRWCAPLPPASLYPGICRVHQVEILDLRGAWEDAEAAASAACQDLVGIDVFAVADGHYAIGELLRRRGDAAAEEAYLRAHEAGRDPQPGLALLRLAQGRMDAASASIDAALVACVGGRLERVRLLAAQVDIALAAGDVGLADSAAAEVAEIAAEFESDGLRAVSNRCRGAVSLAQGKPVLALGSLRLAFATWQELDVPYEVARTRALLAHAYRLLGDDDAAARECAAARRVFARLRADPDLRALDASDAPPGGLTPREVEVLRLIASGQSNREVAATLVISDKTAARHVANIYAKLGISSRSAATTFAHEHALV
jgi:DNA-binding CsgD family transcriptional regulator